MSRELRRVPADWEHPRNEQGNYIPMYEHFPYNRAEIEEGLQDGWLENTPPNYGCDVIPDWPPESCTHYQMYETTTGGTPISPVFADIESLAHWLADHRASALGARTATYEQWLATCNAGSAPSAFMTNGEMHSGVELVSDVRRRCS